jgi:hypothetical protein
MHAPAYCINKNHAFQLFALNQTMSLRKEKPCWSWSPWKTHIAGPVTPLVGGPLMWYVRSGVVCLSAATLRPLGFTLFDPWGPQFDLNPLLLDRRNNCCSIEGTTAARMNQRWNYWQFHLYFHVKLLTDQHHWMMLPTYNKSKQSMSTFHTHWEVLNLFR